MAKKNIILVPTDFSEVCDNAVNHGCDLAKHFEFDVYVLHVITKDTKKIHTNGLFIYMGKELANELLKPFTTKDGEINTAGLFVAGHLNFPSATLVETCANGIKITRDVDNFLEKKELSLNE